MKYRREDFQSPYRFEIPAHQYLRTNRLIVHGPSADISDKQLKSKEKDGAPWGIKAREDLRSALRVNLRPMDYEITSP
jgi:hypothetical protein